MSVLFHAAESMQPAPSTVLSHATAITLLVLASIRGHTRLRRSPAIFDPVLIK